MVEIDETTAVGFAAGSVLIALVLCIAMRRHKRGDAAIGWLMLSNLALLAASMGVLGSAALPFALSTAVVIVGAFSGICFAFFAVMKAERQPLPWRLLSVLGLTGFAAQATIAAHTGSVLFLMATSSVLNTGLILYILFTIWRTTRHHGERLAVLLCLPFAAIGAGYLLRLPVILFWPDGGLPLAATLFIIVSLAWAAVLLELAMITLREAQARTRLKAALREAEEATFARTRFLLAISHDLRTPLNGILGLSELMRAQTLGPLPDTYSAYAEEIHRNGSELAELVSDLMVHSSEGGPEDMPAGASDITAAVRQKFGEDAA